MPYGGLFSRPETGHWPHELTEADLPVIGCMEEVEAAIYRELEARKGAQANPER